MGLYIFLHKFNSVKNIPYRENCFGWMLFLLQIANHYVVLNSIMVHDHDKIFYIVDAAFL